MASGETDYIGLIIGIIWMMIKIIVGSFFEILKMMGSQMIALFKGKGLK